MAFSPADVATLRGLPIEGALQFWDLAEKRGRAEGEMAFRRMKRDLIQSDLYYLLVRGCGRVDMVHPWVFKRVREVEADPDGYLDLWSREHFKSSTITFGLTIQNILNDPEVTFGIFSHTRPIAKAFLRQIMREFESNKVLHLCFPDVLWGQDTRAAPKWSEDDGIIVRRKSNPNEATIEAWGLVDGQPTSKHFKVLLYDDVVVGASVTTPEMIEKTMMRLEESYNLGQAGGVRRFVGTRWHFNDCYKTITDRKTVQLRCHPATDDGTETGNPVYWTRDVLVAKRRDMGPYTFATQILLNPRADAMQGFRREWLRHYKTAGDAKNMVKYVLVDSANAKRKESDYTAMWVVGLGRDGNYYVLDMVRDRLNLTERTKRLFDLHAKWAPKEVRYEKYGLMADIDHIKTTQDIDHYHFDIREVGGQTPKDDRIKRLLPLFEQGRIYLPTSFHVTDYQGETRDLVHDFIEDEYAAFPVSGHKDMLDSLSRIAEPDLKLTWPKAEKPREDPVLPRIADQSVAWMA